MEEPLESLASVVLTCDLDGADGERGDRRDDDDTLWCRGRRSLSASALLVAGRCERMDVILNAIQVLVDLSSKG